MLSSSQYFIEEVRDQHHVNVNLIPKNNANKQYTCACLQWTAPYYSTVQTL